LLRLAETFLATGAKERTGGARTQMMIYVDQATLKGVTEGQCELDGGTPIPFQTARRHACDASCVHIEKNEADEIMSVGRKTRKIPPALRRALEARGRFCAFPGCTCTLFLDAHHIKHWLDGGETKLKNLVLLCRRHHRLVHEEGWRIEVGADGTRSFVHPMQGKLDAVPVPPPLDEAEYKQSIERELTDDDELSVDGLTAIGDCMVSYAFAVEAIYNLSNQRPDPHMKSEPLHA
jgi:hypothetical protein